MYEMGKLTQIKIIPHGKLLKMNNTSKDQFTIGKA